MSIDKQVEREEQELENLYNSGMIELDEYRQEMRELHRSAQEEAQAMAEEAAEQAYRDALGDW